MRAETIMFSLIRKELCGKTVDETIVRALTNEMLEKIYDISYDQDLAHIVGQSLSKLSLLGDNAISQKFRDAAISAVYRHMQMNYAYTLLCNALEQAKISFIPLKGSVIRNLYTEPWMRTSSDIDVLVHEEDLDRAVSVLTTEYGFRYGRLGYHDVSLYSPNHVHIEVHYTLLEEARFSQSQRVLNRVWNYATPVAAGRYQMVLADEMFYFYHILHMANHFCNGGCGIRPFIDIWILTHKVDYDRTARENLLKEGMLLTFAQEVEHTSEVWFSDQAPRPIVAQIQDFILYGGIYGSLENRAVIGQAKSGNKLKYIIEKRIFLSHDFLKEKYKILRKHKWLTPFFQIVRWIDVLRDRGVKRVVYEMRLNTSISGNYTAAVSDMLEKLGL